MQLILTNLRELLYELRKPNYDKEQSINYLYSMIEDFLLKPEPEHNEIIPSKLERTKKGDFGFASGFFGRWAEHASKIRE
jgi:hypothetical protein